MWNGKIKWFHRDGTGRVDEATIYGRGLQGNIAFFQYELLGEQFLATFNTLTGRGDARCVGSPKIHAEFAGSSETSENRIAMRGANWREQHFEYGWEAQMSDRDLGA